MHVGFCELKKNTTYSTLCVFNPIQEIKHTTAFAKTSRYWCSFLVINYTLATMPYIKNKIQAQSIMQHEE